VAIGIRPEVLATLGKSLYKLQYNYHNPAWPCRSVERPWNTIARVMK